MSRVYIQINDSGEIIAINSDAFLPDLDGWLEIDEGIGDRYTHAQNNYLDDSLMTDEGIYRYRYIDSEVVEKTAEELRAEIDALPTLPMGDGEVMRILLNATSEKLPDDKAMLMPERFDEWYPDTYYREGQIVRGKGDLLYRIVMPGGVASLAHQQPWAEGMLAVYKRIQLAGAGPLPWVYGEEIACGDRREHNGTLYECYAPGGAGANIYSPDMVPSVWREVET